MAATHGRKAKFYLDNGAGALTDISAYLKTAGLGRSADKADITTFGADARSFLSGLYDTGIDCGGPFDPTIDGIVDSAFASSTTKTFAYYPAGEAGGGGADATHPKYTGECFADSYNPASDLEGASGMSFHLQGTGAVTRAVA